MATDLPAWPNTAAGHQARWFFDQALTGSAPPEAVFRDHVQEGARLFLPPLESDAGWVTVKTLIESGLGEVASQSETKLSVPVVDERGRRFTFSLVVDPSTGSITELRLERVQEEPVVIRFATEADGPVLADIERRSPMIMGEVGVTIDRGDDYFASARLMEDVGIVVAEVGGQPGAVHCAAAHTVTVAGNRYRLAYYHHLRILPEHQGKGLFGMLAERLGERFNPPYVDGTYAYVAIENAASQRLFSHATSWPVRPLRCTLSTADHRGPRLGRRAGPDDAAEIVDIINTFHGGEEMWTSATMEFLEARLSRAPAQYGWGDVWLGEGAVMGVWAAGRYITEIIDGPRGREVVREGLVLDHGYRTQSEEEFAGLLRAWCTELHGQGIDTLVMFSSESSPSYPLLQRLGAQMHPLDLYLFAPATPEGADGKGVYVDPIYF